MNNEYTDQELFVGNWKEGRLEVETQDHTGATSNDAEGTRRIPLTQGKEAIVDEGWFAFLNQWKWHYLNGYAVRTDHSKTKNRRVHMHRLINQTPEGLQTDHVNGDTLDNRKVNLRSLTNVDNMRNSKLGTKNTSGLRGVSWGKSVNKWTAQISVHNKVIHLGCFVDKYDAHRAYLQACSKFHGELLTPNRNNVPK